MRACVRVCVGAGDQRNTLTKIIERGFRDEHFATYLRKIGGSVS